jgi:hypothetical protein
MISDVQNFAQLALIFKPTAGDLVYVHKNETWYRYNGAQWVLNDVDLGVQVVLPADPASPSDGTWWLRQTGSSPTMSVALRVQIAGVTYTVAEITL